MVRELLAVLVRAALQWALATLLLANGAAFCLIAAAASSLRLGPPCLLCARVHRLLCSDCGQEERDAFRRLLCDAHVAAIARLGAQEAEQPACSPSDHVDAGTKYGGNQSIDFLILFELAAWRGTNGLSLPELLENTSITN